MTATPASDKSKAERRARGILILLGLLLPTLSLVPFGSIWLWQQGYLLYWAAEACLVIVATYLIQRRIFPARAPAAVAAEPDPAATETLGRELGW
jgi:hypothetical protein